MRKKIIMGNWKMNGNSNTAKLLSSVIDEDASIDKTDVVIFPSFPYLPIVSNVKNIAYGAQDVSLHDNGAYTSEVSASMLADLGCKYVLVGHSEKRQYHNESNKNVAKKAKMLLEKNITPVICIGETLEQRESGLLRSTLKNQLEILFEYLSNDEILSIIVAYEPVWAIGTGKVALTNQVQEVHEYIRSLLKTRSEKMADVVRIVYGGSMKPSNASELLSLKDVDGGLIGGASLISEEFLEIIKQA